MISSAATSTVLKLMQVWGRQIQMEQLPSTTGILTALQFLCLYSAYLHSVLFKKQRHWNDGKDLRALSPSPSLSLSLSLSHSHFLRLPFPSFFFRVVLLHSSRPVPRSSHWLPPPPPTFTWESSPGMPDVLQSEAQQCKHRVLPWMPGGPALPSPLCGRGAEEFSEREREGEGSVVAEVLFVFWLERPFSAICCFG